MRLTDSECEKLIIEHPAYASGFEPEDMESLVQVAYLKGCIDTLHKLTLSGVGYNANDNIGYDGRSGPVIWINSQPITGQSVFVINDPELLELISECIIKNSTMVDNSILK